MLCYNNQVKERIRQEQEEEKQRLEAEMQRLVALEEDHRKKVQLKEQEMGKIKEDLEKKWDRERRQVRRKCLEKPCLQGGGLAEWFMALDLNSGGPWFKSSTLPIWICPG